MLVMVQLFLGWALLTSVFFFLPFNGLVSEALLFYFTYFESYQFGALSTVKGLEPKSMVIWKMDMPLD